MKHFFTHIPIYIITVFVLLLSVGVSIKKCNNNNNFCTVAIKETCKKESVSCKEIMEKIKCCKNKMKPLCKKKERNCTAKSIQLQFDFETIIAKIKTIDKCKEIMLFNQENHLVSNLVSKKYSTKHLSFSSPPLLNKPILTKIQVFRL
jgi:hypothetical protein